jgi:tetratricopeptide (TPR) repeat protein
MPLTRKLFYLSLLLGLAILFRLFHWITTRDSSDAKPLASKDTLILTHANVDAAALKDASLTMPKEDLEAVAQIRMGYATGDYGHCLKLAETFEKQKERSRAFKNWLHSQMDKILSSLAWLKLQTGRCDLAVDIFKRAENYAPSLEITKGLAYCHYVNHNLDAAEENVKKFLEISTEKDADVLFTYAEVLESKGRYGEAVKILQELSTLRKEPDLKKKIEGMKEKAKKANLFQTINTQYFALTFEEDIHRDVAEKTLEVLEKSLDDLIVHFHFREPKKQIEVLLYPEQDFRNFNPDSPLWAEALFNGRIRIPVHQPYDLGRLQTTLQHELVHALFSQMTGSRSLPSWFDEGVAQLASHCNGSCTPFVFGLNPGNFLPEKTFQQTFTKYNESVAHHAYKQSLYLVLTLDYRYKGIQSVIESIRVDSSLDSDVLLKHLGISFSKLRKEADLLWQAQYTFKD